ncbi:MAG TPA: ComEC/Rec2 family competence protein [Solirubrobacterales bacterium]|nr:ComEC/Rec2 family competence protein [Solirubrobacterales bacterium]
MASPRLSWPILIGIAVLVAIVVVRTGELRDRAEAGLGQGMPPREAALARGFVLGDDDGVDEATKEDFVRAGLSHLLAVSGENVTLLALLAMPVLAAFGISLRERLVWTIALIAVYVPLAGSGPSIQRAGVMGAAGLVATLAGRRASRLYALVLALVVTLAIDPGVAGNVGWQLSFAAVLGILLLAAPIREWLAVRLGAGRWRRTLAEGIAVTVAATLATAPLIAHVFEEVSLTSLAANVFALPAVAPAMWLGMVSAALAQIPGTPLAALNGLDALFLAYIAQVAAWCGRPSWAVLHVHIGLVAMLATYAAMAGAIVAGAWFARARRLAAARHPGTVVDLSSVPESAVDLRYAYANKGRPRASLVNVGRPRRRGRHGFVTVAILAALAVGALLAWPYGSGPAVAPSFGLRVAVLDVGQGDAILLRPRDAPAVLVDGGPPGDELVAKLRDEGVDGLGAAIVTHDQSDHAAGIAEALGRLPISHLVYGRLDREFLATARSVGARPDQVAAGTMLRSGSLRLEVLWPPPTLLAEDPPGTDPNLLALVIRAHWHRFTMLLTADAEAEVTPLDPGPIDVLKVAHHGSDDAGLGPLLDRIRPRLAVISVGADNSYGHPTAGTLATLAAHRVPTLRTDLDGTIEIDVRRRSFSVH